jgi:hypothetical protein
MSVNLKIEKFMLARMNDGTHDPLQVYRVLYVCLRIAKHSAIVSTGNRKDCNG